MVEFETALRSAIPFIHRIVRGFCENAETARDLTQEVLYKAVRSRKSFEGRSCLNTWLYRIAVNEGIGHCRNQKREFIPFEDVPSTGEDESIRQDIRAVLVQMEGEKRDVLVQYFFLGYNLREIAERNAEPAGTVNARFERAKTEFKKRLEEAGYDYE